MSVQAMSWVWDKSQATGNARLVLLAIADGANKEGRHSCQSVSTMAEMCKLSERTVQRKIAELVQMGEIVNAGVSGRYGTNIYDLTLLSPCQFVTPDKMGTDPRQNMHDDLTRLSPNPINPNISKDIYPRESERSSPPPKAKQARSLPPGWMPTQKTIDDMRYELQKAGKQIDFETEHKKFTDHFNSVAGAAGRKKDWDATWRNWMRRARPERNQETYKPGWQKRGEYYLQQMQGGNTPAWVNQIER